MPMISQSVIGALLFVSILIGQSVYAQTTLSFVPFAVPKSANAPAFVGMQDGMVLFASTDQKKESIKLDWFTADSLKPVFQKDYTLGQLSLDQANFEFGYTNENGVVLFFSRAVENKVTLMLQNLTPGLEPLGTLVSVLEAEISSKKSIPRFGFDVSPGKINCLAYVIPEGILDANTPINMAVVGPTGDILWKKDFFLPYEKNVFDLNSFKIDDFQKVFMLSGLSMRKSFMSASAPQPRNETYVLLTYNNRENKLKEFNIALADKWVNSVSIVISPQNEAIVSGLYSNTMLPGSAGVFYMRINHEKEGIAASAIIPFDKAVVKKFNERPNAREMEQLYFDFIYPQSDGSVWLAGEQYFMTERTYLDPTFARPSTVYEYHFGNIVLVKINPDGSVGAQSVIEKSQVTQNDGGRYSSYYFNLAGNSPVMWFFDHPKNTLDMTDRFRMNNASKSDLVAVVYHQGVLHRQSIIQGNRIDLSVKEFQTLPTGMAATLGRLEREEGMLLFQIDKDFWRK